MLKTAVAVLIALLSTSPLLEAAETHSMTVADLKNYCEAADIGGQHACRFFIFGVELGASLGALQAANHEIYCIPENTPASTMELAVRLRMAEDLVVFPQDRDLDAAGFVVGVFLVSFPCHKAK